MDNTLDFSNEAQNMQDIADSQQWENVDERTIQREISAVNTRVTDLANHLDRVVVENDYEDTLSMLEAVWMNDLSGSGWIVMFHENNRGSFPAVAPSGSKPSWYGTLSPEKKTKYDTVLKYHQDSMWVMNSFREISALLQELPMDDCFRIQRLKINMDEAGFDTELYEEINDHLSDAAIMANTDWGTLEGRAGKSVSYYRNNSGNQSADSFQKGYRSARLQDYIEELKRLDVYEVLENHGDERFTVKPAQMAKAGAIDSYTKKVSEIKGLDDRLKKVLDRSKRIMNEYLNENQKNCTTSSFKDLNAALQFLVEAVQKFADLGLTVYEKFKSGDGHDPYCFMKKLSNLSSFSTRYGLEPSRNDPQSSGTDYKGMYSVISSVITRHCREFVYERGGNAK